MKVIGGPVQLMTPHQLIACIVDNKLRRGDLIPHVPADGPVVCCYQGILCPAGGEELVEGEAERVIGKDESEGIVFGRQGKGAMIIIGIIFPGESEWRQPGRRSFFGNGRLTCKGNKRAWRGTGPGCQDAVPECKDGTHMYAKQTGRISPDGGGVDSGGQVVRDAKIQGPAVELLFF